MQPRLIRQGLWFYFWLLLLEGALRKWIMPDWAAPLLLVRDPLALLLLGGAAMGGGIRFNRYLTGWLALIFCGVVVGPTQELFEPRVMIYGLRANFLHLPLVFVFYRYWDIRDVRRLLRMVLWICLPMTVLVTLQFFSSQGAWVNRGVGGGVGIGFSGAAGYFRPPGTFSFVNGLVLFYSLAAAGYLGLLFDRQMANPILKWASLGCIVTAIPFSISRTLAMSVTLTLVAGCYGLIRQHRMGGRLLQLVLLTAMVGLLLSRFSFFWEGMEAFSSRWTASTTSQGGLQEAIMGRFWQDTVGTLLRLGDFTLLGQGLGAGTNVGSQYLRGQVTFVLGESEYTRVLAESGIVIGLGYLWLRLSLAWKGVRAAHRQLSRESSTSWLLVSFAFLPFICGQWGQPTAQGFATLGLGLVFASLKPAAPARHQKATDNSNPQPKTACVE